MTRTDLTQLPSTRRDYPARTAYVGEQATNYEAARRASGALLRKWEAEERSLSELLDLLPAGSSILDMPAGTGRFVRALESRGLVWNAGDISFDMLRELVRERDSESNQMQRCMVCEAEALPIRRHAVDFVLSTRFFNLIPFSTSREVLAEFARVARSGAIVEIRFRGVRHRDRLTRRLLNFVRRLVQRTRGLHSCPPTAFSGASRYPLPTQAEFTGLAHAAGFRVRRAIKVRDTWHPLQPDPLMFVLLSSD